MRKATLGNLSYQHPLREEEHTAWRGLARQGPLTAAFGDSRQHSLSATPPTQSLPSSIHSGRVCSWKMHPRTTLGSSSAWLQAWGSTRAQEQGRVWRARSAPRHAFSTSESRWPAFPSKLLQKTQGQMLHKEMGWQNHPAMHSHVQKANYSPHSTNPSTHIQCYCLILVLSLRQGLLSPPMIPSVHATPSFLT